jgi:two-component system response regulator DesR
MIRVLIAEDMRILRDALVELLTLETGIDVVAEVASGDAIVPAALESRPDVAVVDIVLPGLDGLTATGLLREQLPQCRVLILTASAGPPTSGRPCAPVPRDSW